ncbi:TetR/AcrR family transcriptional regulator [Methylocaldum szegediense]|uniref:TetR family transcriptional regulator n=1 Tax=Methylocaldum szegediense TaxID=73780 RepID=A0ABN8X5K5_9GAMM|nr:TetR/AcrR family transcriptional regulator [Methylocaldum szegediense]CAI8837939.1 TetR family transcriptional regulator [Methylocaldum szegediense]
MTQDAAPVTPSARDRILETAQRLFYRYGIRAAGVDRIIAESGVAKMSFYRHFPSKKDLVVAFLERRHRFWMDWFTRRVQELAENRTSPGLAVLADALQEWFSEPDFRGCAFINTVAELSEDSAEERRIAADHKRELWDFIRTLIPKQPRFAADDAADLAVLIIDGAIVRAQMTGKAETAEEARTLFRLLDAKLFGSPD